MNGAKNLRAPGESRTSRGFDILIPAILTLIFLGGSLGIFFLVRPPPEQDIRVTAVIKAIANDSEFWEVVKTGMRAGANEFGLRLDIQGAGVESDVDGQIRIIENILRNDPPTVLILAATDFIRLAPLVEEAVSAGVKVITMDSGVDSPLPRTFVATNNVEGGKGRPRNDPRPGTGPEAGHRQPCPGDDHRHRPGAGGSGGFGKGRPLSGSGHLVYQ